MKGIFIPFDTECVTRPPRKCLEIHREGIFVCGGREALCFIPQQNVWYQLSDMVLEHQDHTITQCRDKVYIFDKQRVGPGKSCVLEYYMHSCNSWGTMQATAMDLGEDINSFSTVSVLNGRLYAIGSYSSLIFIYHPEKNNWDLMELPCYQWRTCGIADSRHLYIIGGCSPQSGHGSTKAKRLDLSGYSWDDLAAMNEARHDALGAAMNGKIYVAGGIQKKDRICTVLNTCEVYDPDADEWQLMLSLNGPRHSASMVCFKGALYVVGGVKDNKQTRELLVEIFDSETSKWKKTSTIPVDPKKEEEKVKECHYKACFIMIHKGALRRPINL